MLNLRIKLSHTKMSCSGKKIWILTRLSIIMGTIPRVSYMYKAVRSWDLEKVKKIAHFSLLVLKEMFLLIPREVICIYLCYYFMDEHL